MLCFDISCSSSLNRWRASPGRASRRVTNREIQVLRKARAALAGNWSSLANFGFAPIAGSPVIENFEVLRPHLSDRQWERRDVDVGWYAPECFGVQRRLCSSMGNDAEAMPLELQGHREHEVRHQHRHLKRDDLIHAQSERPERLIARHDARFSTNQRRGRNNVCDIFVNLVDELVGKRLSEDLPERGFMRLQLCLRRQD